MTTMPKLFRLYVLAHAYNAKHPGWMALRVWMHTPFAERLVVRVGFIVLAGLLAGAGMGGMLSATLLYWAISEVLQYKGY